MSLLFQKLIVPEAVAREKSLIDACGFYSVKNHLNNPESPISEIHILDESLELAEVAAFYKSPTGSKYEMAQAMRELLEKGLIRNVDRYLPRLSIYGHSSYTFAQIGMSREVHVIFAPPFFLVKLTDGVWR